MVLRRCRQLLKDEDAALDAIQDVFAKLLQKDLAPLEYPSSYLYTMATRICIDRIRSTHAHAREDGVLESIAAAGNLEDSMFARRILDRIFRRDDNHTRVMAVMFYVDGMRLEEIGEEMGLSVSAIRKRLNRLRSRSARWAARSRTEQALQGIGKDGSP